LAGRDSKRSVRQAESARSTSDKLSYERLVESAARVSLNRVLDKIAPLGIELIASMHGPTVRAYAYELVRAFRE
jgi:flavorubredoxin